MVDKKAEIQYFSKLKNTLTDKAEGIMQKTPEMADQATSRKDSTATADFRLAALGIRQNNLNPETNEAVSKLLAKIDELTDELNKTRENLNELEQLVDVDCLAPIPNRRAFMRRLEWAISMHDRYGFPVSVLYFDLNNLKKINDTYGHSAGDAAIRHVSSVLSAGTRDSDFTARMGGDEFAVILFHSDYSNASRRADALSFKFKASPLVWNGEEIPISAAHGVHSLQEGETPESILIAADAAMYENKKRTKAINLEDQSA